MFRFKFDDATLHQHASSQRITCCFLLILKSSCSVEQDHSDLSVGVAATMAHEMGHNFGMSHDIPGCCQAKAEDGGCIMAAATGYEIQLATIQEIAFIKPGERG